MDMNSIHRNLSDLSVNYDMTTHPGSFAWIISINFTWLFYRNVGHLALLWRTYLPIINEKNKDIRRDLYGGKNKRFQEAHSFHCRIRNTSRTLFVKQIQKAVKNNLWSWHKLVGGLKIDTKYFTHIWRFVGRREELWASKQFSVFPFALFVVI